MLTYLNAQLHPDSVSSIAEAIRLTHELHADAGPAMKIGLAWLYVPSSGNYWHNGATGGYSSFALFNPEKDYAAVVLYNTTISGQDSFADRMGQHIGARLSGKPAISLSE
jgi:CubicO group peptidase (beta-lactamase class C family)